LSGYLVLDLNSTLSGNALLATADPADFHLFALVSIFMSLALVPVALTKSDAPKPIETARLDLPKLFKVSPVAAIGAPLIGLANASFWGVGAVYAQQLGYSNALIAAFVSAVIVGAALLQWPLGWLSDRIDRRRVMLGSSILGVVAALALARFGGASPAALLGFGALFGAFIIPMFGLSAAHANDHSEPGASVETNGGLLLLHGCGSVVGATLGAIVMARFGPPSLFLYIATIYFGFAVFCFYRIIKRPPAPDEKKSRFTPVPKNAAPTVFEIGENEPAEDAEKAA
jgi:MFS family permease